jgi:hypothetical protein
VSRSERENKTGDRIGLFCMGGALTAFFSFVAWFTFAIVTMAMNPALGGRDYWATVGERFENNSVLAVIVCLSCLIASSGVVIMARAILSRRP